MNDNQTKKLKHLTPLQSIRAKCLDCSAFQPKEVRLCTHTECALYSYRMGKNPKRQGTGSTIGRFTKKTPPQANNSSTKSQNESQ